MEPERVSLDHTSLFPVPSCRAALALGEEGVAAWAEEEEEEEEEAELRLSAVRSCTDTDILGGRGGE